MIHAREDYNRIQDPALSDSSLLGEGSTPIGEDEPVMLFRAQDKNFIDVLLAYEDMLRLDYPEDAPILQAIGAQIQRAHEWQLDHGSKTPDLPKT